MPIFRAIGFGILIIVLNLLLPNVLRQGERTAIQFLKGAETSALTATALVEHASTSTTTITSSPTGFPRFALPQAPYPTAF